MEQHILIPLLLTLGAGLATGIGSAVAFFARHTNKRLLAFSLGLSGGVMIYVSFVELLGQAEAALAASWSARTAQGLAVAAFFAGMKLRASCLSASSTASCRRSRTRTRPAR